jgi:Tfp pilus assembly protein PilO
MRLLTIILSLIYTSAFAGMPEELNEKKALEEKLQKSIDKNAKTARKIAEA